MNIPRKLRSIPKAQSLSVWLPKRSKCSSPSELKLRWVNKSVNKACCTSTNADAEPGESDWWIQGFVRNPSVTYIVVTYYLRAPGKACTLQGLSKLNHAVTYRSASYIFACYQVVTYKVVTFYTSAHGEVRWSQQCLSKLIHVVTYISSFNKVVTYKVVTHEVVKPKISLINCLKMNSKLMNASRMVNEY